jgi:hypothetical protein
MCIFYICTHGHAVYVILCMRTHYIWTTHGLYTCVLLLTTSFRSRDVHPNTTTMFYIDCRYVANRLASDTHVHEVFGINLQKEYVKVTVRSSVVTLIYIIYAHLHVYIIIIIVVNCSFHFSVNIQKIISTTFDNISFLSIHHQISFRVYQPV